MRGKDCMHPAYVCIQSFTCLTYVLLTHRENPVASTRDSFVSGKSGNLCSETLLEAVGNTSWAKIHSLELSVLNSYFEG